MVQKFVIVLQRVNLKKKNYSYGQNRFTFIITLPDD